jgi:hypothetical protein
MLWEDDYMADIKRWRDAWEHVKTPNDVPAYENLTPNQIDALYELTFGPLSYTHHVQSYKEWFNPDLPMAFCDYLQRLNGDKHWGGYSEDIHIENYFKDQANQERASEIEAQAQKLIDNATWVEHPQYSDSDYYIVSSDDFEALKNALKLPKY